MLELQNYSIRQIEVIQTEREDLEMWKEKKSSNEICLIVILELQLLYCIIQREVTERLKTRRLRDVESEKVLMKSV